MNFFLFARIDPVHGIKLNIYYDSLILHNFLIVIDADSIIGTGLNSSGGN